MRIQLHVPAGQDLEVHVALAAMQFYVKAGDGIELTLADGEDASTIAVKAVPAGTGAQVAAEALAKAEEERAKELQAEQGKAEEEPEQPAVPVVPTAPEPPTEQLPESPAEPAAEPAAEAVQAEPASEDPAADPAGDSADSDHKPSAE